MADDSASNRLNIKQAVFRWNKHDKWPYVLMWVYETVNQADL